MMKKTGVHIFLVLMVCCLVLVLPAIAAENGKIAFGSYRGAGNYNIYVMNADGTGETYLKYGTSPAWSPDGTKIAYSKITEDIYVMNADGTGETKLTTNPAIDDHPTWSPDGTKIAFYSRRDGYFNIYVMNNDGTGQTGIGTTGSDTYPAWSPDGTKIAFDRTLNFHTGINVINPDGTGLTSLTTVDNSRAAWSPTGTKIAFVSWRDGNGEIYVMNSDGSGQTRITTNSAEDDYPTWSPDGTKIAFSSNRDGNYEIYVMNANGTGQTRITNNIYDDYSPSWGSAPVTPTISVISPNGDQTWYPGTAHTITWSQTGLSGTDVRILLMKGYGFNVAETIAASVPATSGSYTWTVPSTLVSGTDYWVKIVSLSNPDIQGDMWSGWITIPATLTVTIPNGGESWQAGTPHSVTWSQTGLSGTDVKIDLHKDRVFYRSIVSSVAATAGTYAWTIPVDIPAGSTYEVWITSLTSPGVYDYTDGWLTITAAPTIHVITPDGDQTWQPGSVHTITWSQTGLSSTNVRILLMKGYGFNVAETIAASVPATSGSYTWTVPSTLVSGTDYWVKIVSLSYPDIQGDMWSGWITIPGPTGTITVSSPNGGEGVLVGEGYGIQWSFTGNPGANVKLELLKGGALDRVLTPGTPLGDGGIGYYYWDVSPSQPVGDDYSIRISSTLDPSIQDTSDAVFSVMPWSGVVLKTPNSGEIWEKGSIHQITWDYYSRWKATTAELYLLKGGTVIATITKTAPVGSNHQGSYNWRVPELITSGNDYKIRIYTIPGGDSDESDFNFAIVDRIGLQPLPGYEKLPSDPDGDGIYEDLNGNGRLDFADVVLYFNQMEWIAANEPIGAFDLNGNGRIDFADIVKLFGEI